MSSTAFKKKPLRAGIEDLQPCFDLKYKGYQEDVLYSFQKIKTSRAGLEDLQPCCDTKYKGYQEDILYSFVRPKIKNMKTLLEDVIYSLVVIKKFK